MRGFSLKSDAPLMRKLYAQSKAKAKEKKTSSNAAYTQDESGRTGKKSANLIRSYNYEALLCPKIETKDSVPVREKKEKL